jgi:hypothetical protein
LRLKDKQVTLVPASGWPQRFTKGNAAGAESAQPQYTLGEIDEEFPHRLFQSVGQIAKARHLLGMAQVTASQGRTRSASVDVSLEMLRYTDESDAEGELVPHGDAGRELRSGDLISFRVPNPTTHTVDVTLLFVDSGYGITALFPEPGTIDDNRLGPGETFTLPRVEVTADTVGAEQVVAFAVKSGKDRQDFSCLEQPTLQQARAAGGNLKSPRGQLLGGMLYGQNKTRGLKKSEVDTYSVRMLPWVTHPLE